MRTVLVTCLLFVAFIQFWDAAVYAYSFCQFFTFHAKFCRRLSREIWFPSIYVAVAPLLSIRFCRHVSFVCLKGMEHSSVVSFEILKLLSVSAALSETLEYVPDAGRDFHK